MKKKLMPYISGVIIGLSVISVPIACAWFYNSLMVTSNITADSILRYFGGGNGESSTPYIISQPRHLYNLAWLQNKGVFNDSQVYFELKNDIIMGDEWKIPPIGTTDNPFTGVFIGGEHKISDLTITTDSNSWVKHPLDTSVSMGTDVGFFGKISNGGTASHFYLDNINVQTSVDGPVGLIAGNAEGDLKYIGVKDGSMNFLTSGATSKYSLIGYLDEDSMSWSNKPKPGIGALIINPKDLDITLFPKIQGTPTLSGKYEITTSNYVDEHYTVALYPEIMLNENTTLKDYAMIYSKVLNYDDVENKLLSVNISSTGSQKYSKDGSNGSMILDSEYSGIWDAIIASRVIKLSSNVPAFSGTEPKNCIWFDPALDGNCFISFGLYNKRGSSSVSIYQFKRKEGSNEIDTNSVKEIELKFDSTVVANQAILGCNVHVNKEYEYAIGRGSGNQSDNIGLVYLKLPGTDPYSGSIESSNILSVDYVSEIPVPNRDSNNSYDWQSKNNNNELVSYVPHNVLYEVTNSANGGSVQYSVNSSDTVTCTASGSVTVVDRVQNP